VGLAFLVYAAAEVLHGYGFVAVFAAAVTLRKFGSALEYARRLTASARRLERMLAFLVFGLFGGAIASGVLGGIGWREAAFAVLALLVVRPLATLLGFVGSKHPMPVRLALGYFGIRGLGSLYYISREVGANPDHNPLGLWSVTALTVLFSIALYGVTARPVLGVLDRILGRHKSKAH
jgi:NhaP-type Na+/H+ or K+/H+ antiporter